MRGIPGETNPRILAFGDARDVRDHASYLIDVWRRCPGLMVTFSGEPNIPEENVRAFVETFLEVAGV